jgi:hypothetical protein
VAQLVEVNAQISRLEKNPNSNAQRSQKPFSKLSDGVTKGLPMDSGKISPTKFQPTHQGTEAGKFILAKEKTNFRTVMPKTVENFNSRTSEPFEKPKLEILQREYNQIFKAIENFDSCQESVDLSNYEFDELEKERMLMAQRKKSQSSQSLGDEVNLIPKVGLGVELAPAKDVGGIVGKFEANLNEDLLKMKIQFLERRIKAIEGTKDASAVEIEEPVDIRLPEQDFIQQEVEASTDRNNLQSKKSKRSFQVGNHGNASESSDRRLIEDALQEPYQ